MIRLLRSRSCTFCVSPVPKDLRHRSSTMVPPSRRPLKRTLLPCFTWNPVSRSLPNRIMMLAVASFVFLSFVLMSDSSFLIQANKQIHRVVLTADELRNLVHDIKGNDNRLMRWDALEHTRARQASGGSCDDSLADALSTLIVSSHSPEVQGLACEFATFCVTDNPQNRAFLHQHQHEGLLHLHLHQAIVNLVGSSDSHASAMACHLIYIASFADAENHQLFYEAGAVPALATIIKDDLKARPVQTMWAAAALQNLAASYCATQHDGRCYWNWPEDTSIHHVDITEDSLPLLTDGTLVRQDMLKDQELVERLLTLACQGPVKGKPTSNNPFPGVNAVAGEDDDSPNIVPWAAAGAIKNLALQEEDSEFATALQKAVPCLCRLAHVSGDWLEENKGQGALHHLRRGGSPCWFGNSKAGDEYETGKLCVDLTFLDSEDYTCADYGDASEEECGKANQDNVTPNEACCGCGGGEREANARRTEEL